MKKIIMLLAASAVLAGCASSQPAQVKSVQAETKKVAVASKQARLDVRKTVSSLLDYCEKWASAYEANLGKDPVEAFNECVELTSDNMLKQAKSRTKASLSNPVDFPFNQ